MSGEIPSIDPPQLRQDAFHLQRLANLNYPQPQVWKSEQPHRHNFQELIWIESGSGVHEVDGTPLALRPHTLYLIAQGQVHCFREASELHGYVLRFTDDFLPGFNPSDTNSLHHVLFNNVQALSVLRIDSKDTQNIERLLALIAEEYQRSSTLGGDTVLGHLLQVVLIKIERLLLDSTADRESGEPNRSLYARFLKLLETHFTTYHTVEFYADTLATTTRQLSATVKHHQGKTAKQLIEERLILEAKRHLRFTGQSVKEIAHRLGFDDPSYFSKVFRRHTALSPQDFKAHNAS